MAFGIPNARDFIRLSQAFALVAGSAFADQNTPSSNPPLVEHTFDDITPSPEAHFNEHEGIKFVKPFGRMTMPPEGERATVLPSEMSSVGRLIGVDKNGEKTYLCALTVINPPQPFKIAGNGNDVAATAGHCIPSDGIESYAGNYVSYEGLFTGSNGKQIIVPIADIHHNQTNQDINLTHLSDEIRETSLARKYLLNALYYTRIFDTAIVQFSEPLPASIEKIDVEMNILNNLTNDHNTNYFGYPRNTRGLTTDPQSKVIAIQGSAFASDAYTNNGSSGGIFTYNGSGVGVLHGEFGDLEASEWTYSHFNLPPSASNHFTMVSRIDTPGPYVNAPFLDIDNSGIEVVSIKAGTETNLLPSSETIVPGSRPVLEDENVTYQVLDRQKGFVGILIEDPQTSVFFDTNLFYVPETTVIGGKEPLDPKNLTPEKPTHQPIVRRQTPKR